MKKLVISVTVWFLLLLFYMLKHSDLKVREIRKFGSQGGLVVIEPPTTASRGSTLAPACMWAEFQSISTY